MNDQKKLAYQIIAGLFLVLQIFTNGYAADASFQIDLTGGPGSVKVSGRFTDDSRITNRKNLGFLNTAAGISGLGKRISAVRLLDAAGRMVEAKRFADGEYVAERDFQAWEYSIDLTFPRSAPAAAAHVSWLGNENGILMTDDLLPQFVANGSPAAAAVELKIPAGWRSFDVANGRVDDVTKGVLYVGKSFRYKQLSTGGITVNLLITDAWHFTDDEASEMTAGIIQKYVGLFGSRPAEAVNITLMKFPASIAHGVWEAETRGRNVTLLSSDMAFKTQSLQRLHEQLRHEIFHLWIPNGLKLKGNYAWFYEGFALYQSLKLAVAVNRIRFDDYLDTLSRALAIDRQERRKPLIDAEGRSAGHADTAVYARGMLIAFLLDVAMTRESKGGKNGSRISRELIDRYAKGPGDEGNTAVLSVIGRPEFARRYILGAEPFEMEKELAGTGITIEVNGRSPVLGVRAKPSGREKEILDRLGYNNWRKGPGSLKK